MCLVQMGGSVSLMGSFNMSNVMAKKEGKHNQQPRNGHVVGMIRETGALQSPICSEKHILPQHEVFFKWEEKIHNNDYWLFWCEILFG